MHGNLDMPSDHHGTIWLVTDSAEGPILDGKRSNCEIIAKLSDGRKVYAVPLPLNQTKGLTIKALANDIRIRLDYIPDVPTKEFDVASGSPIDGDILMLRVKQIWARLREVEETIADPATLWTQLLELWVGTNTNAKPWMDEIVKQAQALGSTIEHLAKSPRHILRRVHKQIPLSRVQEIDRRAMTWLIRQPGETIAERAGDRQRIQAVAREENFNTLENRVVLSYARLAHKFAKAYAPSNNKTELRKRHRLVKAYGKRCNQLASDFCDIGISETLPDATPNFVLQNNPNYRSIWNAWRLLLAKERALDELWRWQAHSWEEFSALALMVALQSIEGAELIATSPIIFRNEQQRGRWIETSNPLGVIYLSKENLIVEVQYGLRNNRLETICAPVWLRVGKADSWSILSRIAVWPMWDAKGGLVTGEVAEITQVLKAVKKSLPDLSVDGALIIRPSDDKPISGDVQLNVAQVTLGAAGEGLRGGIQYLAHTVRELVEKVAK